MSTTNSMQFNDSFNENKKFYKAFRINDMNERSLFFFNSCLKNYEGINKKFLDNFDLVISFMFEACIDENCDTEYILEQILNRRKETYSTLERHYSVYGCNSDEAKLAIKHYRLFSSFKEEDIKYLILK